MRKRIWAMMLAGMLVCMNTVPVWAAETNTLAGTDTDTAAEEGINADSTAAEGGGTEEGTDGESAGIKIPVGNMADVDVIDLSLHAEESGEFTPVYAYENPFKGKDTSKGVIIEFYADPTWEVHELAAIFAFNGSGDYDGKLYFTPGSYLGFNSDNFGGYFDANLFNYTIVTDYIKDGAKMRVELMPDGFAVYANDTLCYDQNILDDPSAGAGDFDGSSDFSGVLTWLSGAEALYFGYGSWWNSVGTNEANIDLSDINFRLQDGTVVMDQLRVDKDLVESLGGIVNSQTAQASSETGTAGAVQVQLFDINSVEYEGISVLPGMITAVSAVAVAAVIVIIAVTRKRTYPDV